MQLDLRTADNMVANGGNEVVFVAMSASGTRSAARKSACDETPFDAAATARQAEFVPGFDVAREIQRRCWRSAATIRFAGSPKRSPNVPNPRVCCRQEQPAHPRQIAPTSASAPAC